MRVLQVCLKHTDFLGDQVLLAASAHGGLSEVPKEHFRSCSNALKLAGEIGQFGHRPEVGPTFRIMHSCKSKTSHDCPLGTSWA